MVRRELVGRKVARAEAWLSDAERILARGGGAPSRDVEERDLATFYLFLAIQECIDLAAHWVSDSGWAPPDDAGGTFDLLAEHGVIPPAVADGMRSAVGLRNRIAHGYASVDHQRLYSESTAGLAVIRLFLASLARVAGSD